MVRLKSSPKGTGNCSPPARKQANRLRRHARSAAPALLLCQGGARFQCVEDDADELSLETADRFAAALPFCLFALEVGERRGVIARLRDRDPVERAVELPVATTVKAVALHAA